MESMYRKKSESENERKRDRQTDTQHTQREKKRESEKDQFGECILVSRSSCDGSPHLHFQGLKAFLLTLV